MLLHSVVTILQITKTQHKKVHTVFELIKNLRILKHVEVAFQ